MPLHGADCARLAPARRETASWGLARTGGQPPEPRRSHAGCYDVNTCCSFATFTGVGSPPARAGSDEPPLGARSSQRRRAALVLLPLGAPCVSGRPHCRVEGFSRVRPIIRTPERSAVNRRRLRGTAPMVNYGFLSPYPPTKCALATFCVALLHHLEAPRADERCGVVHVVDALSEHELGDTAMRLVSGRPVSALRAADALNQFDVVIVQHDFDVYGGPDGEEVLDVLAGVEKPVITVLHTVPAAPTPHKRQVLQRIINASSAVVVLSRTAALTLTDSYRIGAAHVSMIPQGALTADSSQPGPRPDGRPPCSRGACSV